MTTADDVPLSKGERGAMKEYWEEHSAKATVETMMLDSKAADIDKLERPEVLSLLGSVEGKRLVELGAGIGRFTTPLAEKAKSVIALDFMQNLIDQNRAINEHLGNVEFLCGDATELDLPAASVDVVFSNWLLMYLGDEEVARFAASALRWVPPGGQCFFRESCFRQSGDRARGANPSHYRSPRDYFAAFDAARARDPDTGVEYGWELVRCRCLDTYVQVKRNQNQVCWLWTKAPVPERPPRVTRAFLDGAQYSSRSIARYEAVFGEGHLSPGGAARAVEAARALGLRAGQRALDVGCGSGGGVLEAARASGARVHGVDLSVNAVLLALGRIADGGADVSFEVADAARPGALGADAAYDAAVARESLLHVADKRAVLAAVLAALKPGGRLLVTDYALGEGGAAGGEGGAAGGEATRPAAAPSPPAAAKPAAGPASPAPAAARPASPGTPTTPREGFAAHAAERGYSLTTVEGLADEVRRAGFETLEVRDDSARFADVLGAELARLEARQDAFVGEFSHDEYLAARTSWAAKLERVRDGSMRWAWVLARKPEA